MNNLINNELTIRINRKEHDTGLLINQPPEFTLNIARVHIQIAVECVAHPTQGSTRAEFLPLLLLYQVPLFLFLRPVG